MSRVPVAVAINSTTCRNVLVLGAESGSARRRRFLGFPAALEVIDAGAFTGISTAPVLSADEVVLVGFVGNDLALGVALADGFENG